MTIETKIESALRVSMWLGYLVYSLGNYGIKLCIEIGLTSI